MKAGPKSSSRDDHHHHHHCCTAGGEEKENSLRGFVLPRKSRQEHAKKTYRQGRWSNEERLLFLKGLRRFGAGQWKEIGLYVTTRYVVVVHARQTFMQHQPLLSHTLLVTLQIH